MSGEYEKTILAATEKVEFQGYGQGKTPHRHIAPVF